MWALRVGRSGSIYNTKISKYHTPEPTVKHLLSSCPAPPRQELGNEAVARGKVRLAWGGGCGVGGRERYNTGVREARGEPPKLLAGETSRERTGQ